MSDLLPLLHEQHWRRTLERAGWRVVTERPAVDDGACACARCGRTETQRWWASGVGLCAACHAAWLLGVT